MLTCDVHKKKSPTFSETKQSEMNIKKKKSQNFPETKLKDQREREREVPPEFAGNFPTGDFLGAAFLNLQNLREKHKNPFELTDKTTTLTTTNSSKPHNLIMNRTEQTQMRFISFHIIIT